AQQLDREVDEGAFAVAAEGELPRVGLAIRDQVLDALERDARMHDQRQEIRDGDLDRHEVLQRVVGDLLVRDRHDHHVAALPAAYGVAVRRDLGEKLQADLAAGPGAVVRSELLTQVLAQLLPDQPGQRVATVPRGSRDDHPYGLDRIALRGRIA